MINGAPVNVLDYGAIGDGNSANAATNTAAFVAALAASKSVFVPEGTFVLSDDALIDITDRTLFGVTPSGIPSGLGLDQNTSTIRGNGDLFIINQRGSVLQNLSIYNTATKGKLVTVGGAGGYNKCQFLSCYFGAAEYHIYQDNLGDLVDWYVYNCVFEGATLWSRYFTQLWAYTEDKCYTWYNNNGFRMQCGTTVAIQNSTFELQTGVAVSLANDSVSNELDNVRFASVHFERNGSSIGNPDVEILTSAATRIQAVTFENCSFWLPDVLQAYRCEVTSGGGGNIYYVSFNNCAVSGSAALVNNTFRVMVNQTYSNGAVVYPNNSRTFVAVTQLQNNYLGASYSTGAEAGSSATIATVPIVTGTKFAQINITGNYYNGVPNTNNGYLVAIYSVSGSRIHKLFDVNNSTGSNQGFDVVVSGTDFLIKNKAALTANQSGDATIMFYG